MSEPRDYFSLFGLPQRFDLDVAKLNHDYRELQKRFHPDRFAAGSEQERLLALSFAAQINDALVTLKSPVLRAEYLLSLRGVDMKGEHATFQDTAFLMEQIELREQLEEIEQQADVDEAIDQFAQTLKNINRQLIAELTELFDVELIAVSEADDAGQQPLLETAANLVRKLKFFEKLGTELEQLEERLLDD